MSIRKNHFSIVLITALAAVTGSLLTAQGMDWYEGIKLPEIAPAGSFIGAVWTIIFALTACSVMIFWNAPRGKDFKSISVLFVANAGLNVFWSLLFFTLHLFIWAIVEMILLNLVNLVLILLLYKYERRSSLLLVPYFLWVSFATYLTYLIYLLNQ